MSVMKNQFKKSKISIWARHRKRFRLYSIFFPLFTLKRVVKQLSSTHPLFCWLLNSKHSLIRKEHHSLNAHINFHPTPLISFQIPAAYAIYWAVSELLSIFSSWFSKPVSKKRGKSDPVSEHLLSAIPPLLNVNREKISWCILMFFVSNTPFLSTSCHSRPVSGSWKVI